MIKRGYYAFKLNYVHNEVVAKKVIRCKEAIKKTLKGKLILSKVFLATTVAFREGGKAKV